MLFRRFYYIKSMVVLRNENKIKCDETIGNLVENKEIRFLKYATKFHKIIHLKKK